MATAIRTIGHEDRLSLVDHLEELRTRLIVSVRRAGGRVRLLPVAEPRAAAHHQQTAADADPEAGRQGRGHGRPGGRWRSRALLEASPRARRPPWACSTEPGSGLSAADARAAGAADRHAEGRRGARSRATRRATTRSTLGIGEPFTTTITVTLYFALIVSLPVILFELYGFILPALSRTSGASAMPLLTRRPVPVRGRRAVRLLRRAAGGGALLRELQLQRVQRARAGQPVLQLRGHRAAGDGARLPGARRDPRRDAPRARDAAPAAQEPPLRARRVRGGRRVPARRRDHAGARRRCRCTCSTRSSILLAALVGRGGSRASPRRAARAPQAPGIPRGIRRHHHRRTQRSQPCRR